MAIYNLLGILAMSIGCSKGSDETRLTGHLLNSYAQLSGGYQQASPPTYSPNGTLTVTFGVSLIEVDIDTSLHVLTSKVFLKYTWEDTFLRWTPKDFGGVHSVRAPIQAIWVPDIKLYNSYDQNMEVDDTALAIVTSNGSVMLVVPAKMRSRCARQTRQEWNCTLKFGSWTFDGQRLDIDFFNHQSEMELEDFNPALWEVVEHGAEKQFKYYSCCDQPFSSLVFNARLRRLPQKKRRRQND